MRLPDPKRRGVAIATGLFLLGAGCGSAPRTTAEAVQARAVPSLHGEAIQLATSPELEEIAALESGRTTGNGRLLELATQGNPRVRARAVRALGRLPYPEFGREVTEALCRKLEDADAQQEAAFALGLRADPASAGVLASYLNDTDPSFRAVIVEAASRVPDARLHRELLVALRDADLSVRIEAALGTARFANDDPPPAEVDRALVDALRPFTIATERTHRTAVEAELVWRILYALSRRNSELGRGAFLEYASSDVPLERLFAVMGLARLSPNEESVRALAATLTGARAHADWRAAYEAAVGLGKAADLRGVEALLSAIEHPSAHVRAAALESLGAFPTLADRTLQVLRRGLVDLSAEVRTASLRALVKVLPGEQALETVRTFAADSDAVLRHGAAETLAGLPGEAALGLLRALVRDPDPFVATRAVEALGQRTEPEVRDDLHGLLAHADNGMRLSAVLALREHPDPSDEASLRAAFETSTGDVSAEVAFESLRDLGKVGGAGAEALVRRALDDPRAQVRRVARSVLQESFGATPPPETPLPGAPDPSVPVVGRDFPAWTTNPMVEIQTTRGTLVFELFPAEAPVHVHNFLSLARAREYDGRTFHRVVPDFVVQGGDYRGDGNGARPWKGEALRHEFGRRRFEFGALGMPRNEDPDSGGSQFFVTQRPTPHLDGRYTLFGELRSGADVLDKIEVGDRILGVRALP